MPTVVLVRHGRSAANATAVLAGRTPGVALDDRGRAQADDLALRLAGLSLAAIVTSPLDRCLETAAPLARSHHQDIEIDEGFLECDYGDWTNRELKSLAAEPAWRAVQAHPSSVTFPGGESMRGMQARAVEAVRGWNARLSAAPGPPPPEPGAVDPPAGGAPADVVWLVVTHADVIKAVLADALGIHLDGFQRIVVDVASVSVVRYTELRPFVLRVNDRGGRYDDLVVTEPAGGAGDAVVGGPPDAAT